MNPNLIAATTTLITVLLAFVLIYYRWQKYVIDATRQQLFELRDEVFDMATRGEIDRAHEAYQVVREMFNSCIRFAHRMQPWRVICIGILTRTVRKGEMESASRKVQETLNRVEDGEVRNKLLNSLSEMHFVLFSQLVRISPVFTIVVLISFLLSFSLRPFSKMKDDFGNTLNGVTYSDAMEHCGVVAR